MPWRGAIKLTAPEPDVMITLELWPDFRAFANFQLTGEPTSMLGQFDPYIRYSVYAGEIADPALSTIDTTGLRRIGGSDLHAAGTSTFDVPGAGELRLSFPELRQYSVFLVSRDVGIPVVLAAAILVLVGLIPSLYVSRRKVWIRAEAAPGGALVKIGGFALQRKDAFEEEFDRIVRGIGGREAVEVATGGEGGDVVNWARISSTFFDVTIWLYLGAMVLSFAYLAARQNRLWVLARVVAIAGVAANLVSIVARGMAADRVPWGNMFEYSTVLAFLVVVGTLVIVEGVGEDQDAHRVLADVLGAHARDRGDVLPGRAEPAATGAQLVLDQDPRGGGDHRVLALRDRWDRDDPVPAQGPIGASCARGGPRARARPDHGRRRRGRRAARPPARIRRVPGERPSPGAAASCRPPPPSTASRIA